MATQGKRTQDDLARLHGETVPRPARRPGFQPGNQHARKHGVFAVYFIDEDESFARLRERFSKEYPSETAVDETALDLVCVYLLRLSRAIKAGEVNYIVKLDGTVRNRLHDLKATRINREGDKPTGPETTPAEWASNLLASGETRSSVGKTKRGTLKEERAAPDVAASATRSASTSAESLPCENPQAPGRPADVGC